MNKFAIVISYILLTSSLVFSQETALKTKDFYTYSELQESVFLENNEIKNARETSLQSTLDIKNAQANLHPSISLGLTASYLHNFPIADIYVDLEDLFADSNSTVDWPEGETNVTEFDNNVFSASLSLMQPIFLWGKIFKGIDLFEIKSDISNIQLSDTEKKLNAELLSQLIAIYYLEKMEEELLAQQIKAQRLVTISESAYEKGSLLLQEVLEAKTDASEIDISLIQTQSQINSLIFELRSMTGLSSLQESDIAHNKDFIENILQQSIALSNVDRNILIEQALLPERTAMQISDLAYNAALITDAIANNNMYWNPNAVLQSSLSYGGSIQSFQNTGFADLDKLSFRVSVAIQTDLWDGGKKINNRQKTESQIRQAEISKLEAQQSVTQMIDEKINDIKLAAAQITYYEDMQETISLRVEHEQKLFNLGAGSEMDVLMNEIDLGVAKINAFQEKITLASSYYTIQYLLGN